MSYTLIEKSSFDSYPVVDQNKIINISTVKVISHFPVYNLSSNDFYLIEITSFKEGEVKIFNEYTLREVKAIVDSGIYEEETIISSDPNIRNAYDGIGNLIYTASDSQHTDRFGPSTNANRFFIEKFTYDSLYNVVGIATATNVVSVEADEVTIDTSSDSDHVIITLPSLGDFSEINPDDTVTLITPTNTITGIKITFTDHQSQIKILKADASGMVNEVGTRPTSLRITLNHKSTKGMSRRRWEHRERYVYSSQ